MCLTRFDYSLSVFLSPPSVPLRSPSLSLCVCGGGGGECVVCVGADACVGCVCP
jgi:hypothetical protein